MDLSIHNRALMRGLFAGAVVFAGVSACSRSDRTETGRDNTAAVSPDSTSTQAANSAVTPPAGDSASVAGVDTGTTSGAATAGSTTPRSKASTAQRSIRDTSSAGYRSMERDTTTEPSAPTDTARATTDSVLMPDGQAAVTPSDSAPMEVATPTAADTSVSNPDVAVQDSASGEVVATPADSSIEMAGAASTATTDTSAAVDMSADTAEAGYVNIAQDTSAAPAQADSGVAMEAGVDTTDTDSSATEIAAVGADDDVAADSTETLGQVPESEPIRPPEDSTEVYGAVTPDENAGNAEIETANASENRSDEVGAAALGGNVNGADAVVLMTRQGAQCIVVGPETAQGGLVEMSDTPASLNPCGLGSMVLSRIWTRIE